MTNHDTVDKSIEETEATILKHYGYDNWNWLMDHPLEQNFNAANSSQDSS